MAADSVFVFLFVFVFVFLFVFVFVFAFVFVLRGKKLAPPTQRSLLIRWLHIGMLGRPGHTIYSPIIEKWLGSYA